MTGQMQNKVCVITGGAGSIGAASAKLLRDEGAKVMLVDIDQAALQKTATGIGGDVAWYAADVTKSDQVEAAIATTLERFGKIDVLFSNPAISERSLRSPTIPKMYLTRCWRCMFVAPSCAPSMRCRR
jgi:NAD(P)-dependent dehydrogenase (short-subunit alcohol dehydrogenase family)